MTFAATLLATSMLGWIGIGILVIAVLILFGIFLPDFMDFD